MVSHVLFCYYLFIYVLRFVPWNLLTLRRAGLQGFTRLHLGRPRLSSRPGCDFDTLVPQKTALSRASQSRSMAHGLLLKSPRGWTRMIRPQADCPSHLSLGRADAVAAHGRTGNLPRLPGTLWNPPLLLWFPAGQPCGVCKILLVLPGGPTLLGCPKPPARPSVHAAPSRQGVLPPELLHRLGCFP